MKLLKTISKVALLAFMFFLFSINSKAQTNLAGTYTDTGYFFHPSNPRSINQLKTLIQVDTRTYQMSFGDWPSTQYSFQFQIDSNNNLVNWIPLYFTPSYPYSGFMTLDNPGNTGYNVAPLPLPGQSPYLQSFYNNTYNPTTKTFYFHYGYNSSSNGISGQNGYTRQVYEILQVPPVKPVPTITSFSPTSAKSGDVDTITGTNLTYLTKVTFGDSSATSFVVLNDSVATAIVGTGGSGSVKVTTLSGTDSLAGFTYLSVAPTITSFSPTSTSNGGYVYIYGTGLLGTTSVSFGGVPAIDFTAINDGSLYAYVGTGASGNVTVTTLGGTATLAGFTYVAPPIIKSFSPTSAATGTTITILGSGFTNLTSLYLGNTYNTNYSIVNDSTITVVVGTGSSGSIVIYTSSSRVALSGFTYLAPAPTITSFTPTSAGTNGYVIIYGTGLTTTSSVKFGGVAASSIYLSSDTYIQAYVGTGATGNVSVTTAGGTATLAGFTYLNSPIVKSFSPSSAATGTTVTIKGSYFTNATNVSFGGTYASNYIVVNDSVITATVATGSSGNIIVYSAAGSGILGGFTYKAPVPLITSFSPTSSGNGGYVYIYGTGFTGVTSVTFGGVVASYFYASSDTYIYAYVGNGASGKVSVTTSGGTGTLAGFTYLNAPVIKSFSPASASTGTTVTIKGSYFTNATNVSFGGTYASNYTVVNDSVITATVSTGSSGNITVYSSAGSGFLGGFTYKAPVPVITSFSSTSAGKGGYVDIFGTGFSNATSVSFGGVAATSFYVYSDTYISATVGNGASGSVSVTTSGGTGTLAGFTFLQAPVITSFSPTSATKGTTVVIKGKGFNNANTVYFGGTYASNYTVVNDSTINAIVGSGSTGSISVSTSAGTGILGGFTYIAPMPVISSFSPTSAGKGGYIYIYGTGFTGTTAVSFGGVPASSFSSYSDTYIYAYVGNGASGNVSVTTSGGIATLGGFTYIKPATINSFAPTSATKGTIITIFGSGFLYANNVSFGGTNASNFTIIDDSTLTAIVGAGTSGSVSVTTSGGTGSLVGFTYLAPVPVITSFSPTSAGKGSYVNIYGSGFSGATSVLFGGVAATSFYVSNDNNMYAYVGNGASGSVSVTTSGGTGNRSGFTYLAPPTITSFYPTTATQGDTITITGTGFTNASYIYFGGNNAASFKVINDNTIKAVVGAGKSGNVTVYTSVGSSILAGFTYIAPVPTITSLSSNSATKGGYISIYGTGFTGATSVTFGGVPASSFYVNSDTYLYAYVGNGATGIVSVITPGGTATYKGFIYATTPNITTFYPTTATRGDTVTIYGTSLSGTTSVYFGGTNATSYTVVDDKTIEVVVGNGSTGSVMVYNPAGSSSLTGFTYTTPPPLITSFSPTSTTTGNYVYINGAGFTGATAVSFGGVPATNFYVYSDTYMYAYVGSGASGSVSVTTANGTGSLAGFVYAVTPTISSFYPTQATRGDSVTIYGKGLSGATSVYFGGTYAASYIVVNDTTISAVVASGTSGNITVYNPAGSSYKAGFTYKAPLPVITSFSPTSAATGNSVYVYGTGLSGTTSVSFGGVKATSFYAYSDTYLYAYVGNGASGNVSVTTAAGTASLAGFTYLSAPTISSFSPTTATQGDTVTIIGHGFTNTTYVYFGGTNATSYLVLNDSTLKAIVAAGRSGRITVYNSIGSNSIAGFIYKAPVPTISSFAPTSGGKGSYVSVYGTGFTGATAVSFGGVPAASFYVSNDTYLYAYVGTGASGSVSVTTPGGTASLVGFTYTGPPTITSFTPKAGISGSTVTIYGHGFANNTASVSFGGDTAGSYTVLNDSAITAILGMGASGSVGVVTRYGTATLAGFSYCKPSLDTISKIACGSYTWHKVTYSKSGSYNFDTVSVGGCDSLTTLVLMINKPTADTISLTAVSSYSWHGTTYTKSGIYTFDTINAFGCDSLISLNLTVKFPLPVIISFNPTSAITGDTVTINGKNFTGTTSVTFGNVDATSFEVLSDNVITAIVSGGSSGNVYVTNNVGTDSLAGFNYCNSITIPSVSISASATSISTSQTSVIFSTSLSYTPSSPAYQWYKDNSSISRGTAETLNINGLSCNDSIWVVLNDNGVACTVTKNIISNKIGIYVSDAIITTIAGNGINGYSGDGGSATTAELNFPRGVAIDASGNIYLADGDNNVIRKVSTNGIITTIAGNGTSGYSGDGGIATAAQLNFPIGIAVDASGNIFVADKNNKRIRKVNTNGIITTVAGTGYAGFSGDGGLATGAQLNFPYSVTVDNSGNLYIADDSNNRIRKVNTNGIINTVAGNGTKGFSGDGGKASDAKLNLPTCVKVDSLGNLYIVDNGNKRIRKVDTNGNITTIAGTEYVGGSYSGDGGKATEAKLNFPTDVVLDKSGNLYIADHLNNRIRIVNTNGIINTVAGNGFGTAYAGGYSGDGGSAFDAELNNPAQLALDGLGNLYISDNYNHRIRKVSFGVLPITLSSFSATAINKTIQTNWFTATELNTSHFIVQHSTNGSTFTDLGSVKAIGIGANKYAYTDVSPVVGTNYYRLKSVDKDGAVTYSKIVTAAFTTNNSALTTFPNPTRGNVTIKGNHIVLVQVVDNFGREVKVVTFKDASNPSLSVSSLATGVYNLRVQTTDGKVNRIGMVKE